MTTLKKGSKGDDVKKLQKLLGLTADGDFGPKTETAVKEFQKKNGLVADGIVGAKTWALLEKSTVTTTTNSKCVDSSVIYMPLRSCITKMSNRTIKYIAIHYTAGGSSAPGRAQGLRAMWESAKRASADFGVDDRDMVQFNPDLKNYYCWSVGDKKAAKVNNPDGRNGNTISIEICSNIKSGASVAMPNHEGWYFNEAALNNAVRLTKILMKKFNIPVERVVRHYDISGKLCPGIVGWNDGILYNTSGKITNKRNNSEKWKAFKNRLK